MYISFFHWGMGREVMCHLLKFSCWPRQTLLSSPLPALSPAERRHPVRRQRATVPLRTAADDCRPSRVAGHTAGGVWAGMCVCVNFGNFFVHCLELLLSFLRKEALFLVFHTFILVIIQYSNIMIEW